MTVIIFDFDGVLADTLDDMLNFAREACAQLGIPREPTPADLDALEKMSFEEYGRQLKLPPQAIDEFVRRCLQMFNQRQNPPKIFAGMEQVVTAVSKHQKVAIVTGNTKQTVERFIEEQGLQKHIAMVIGVDQPGSRLEKVRVVLNKLADYGENACIVGDSLSDIDTARQASIQSIAVSWGHQSKLKLAQAEPDYLVDSPQELLQILFEI